MERKLNMEDPNTSLVFLIRCIIGLQFDAVEYGILTATADDIDYDRFRDIFIVYSVFVASIIVTFLCSKEVYIFIFALFFKCISLSVAFSIFTTTSHFEWETIETIDSAEDFFTALLIFVSFADICLNIAILILKMMFICCKTVLSKKGCCDKFWDLMCTPAGQVGVND